MKYRVLTPNEMEAYKIGYKVGARELFITEQEWESEEEHQIYRKGYLAGCKDRQRKNLKPELLAQCQQCQQCQNRYSQYSYDSVTDTVIDIEKKDNRDNKGGVGEKEEKKGNKPTLEEVIEYAKEQNSFAGVGGFVCTPEQAEEFWSYYESQGWRIGNDSNTPIRDWKPKLRQWCVKAKQASAIKTAKLSKQPTILNLSARERQDLINKQKTEMLLKQLKEGEIK